MQRPVKGAALKCRQELHLLDEDYTSKLCSCCKKAPQTIYGARISEQYIPLDAA